MKYLFFILIILGATAKAQEERSLPTGKDSIVIDNGGKDSITIFRPTIEDYKFRTETADFQSIDTTFTASKSYSYTQYNNRDNFGKIQFNNIGSGFHSLVFRLNKEQNLNLLPTNKSYAIQGIDDIKYYDVKTPTTAFLYHNSMKNGGALQTLYTQNFGKRLNLAIEYTGLRSQGFYTNSLASNNNITLSGRYLSKDEKYQLYGHFIHQNMDNEENGGMKNPLLLNDDNYTNRQTIPVKLTDTHSQFSYRRYYLSHSFLPFNKEKLPFKLTHKLYYQINKYYFNIGSTDIAAFNNYDTNKNGNTKKYYNQLSNTFSLVFDRPAFYLDAGLRHQNIILGAESYTADTPYNEEKKENRLGIIGNLKINLWDKVGLHSSLEYSNGKSFGNFLRTDNQLKFEPVKDFFVDGKLLFQSSAPSFNYLVNLSPVNGFNYGFRDFKNENILEIGGRVGIKWFDAEFFARYFRIENFAYFTSEGQSAQSSSPLNISQIGGEATLSYNKFHLNMRLHFQHNLSESALFPSPKFIGRANLYYKTSAFKKAAEIMGGIKLYYFTKFASREYAPILNEFILPANGYNIGGKPIVEAYFNMKVKRMQIYLEGQNISTTFAKNKAFTAPYYPLYDFRLNIGIIWYLFH